MFCLVNNLLDSVNLIDIQIRNDEIEEMIANVDKNGDGKISYSEFRVIMGAVPLLLPK